MPKANKTLYQFDDSVTKNLKKTLFDFEDDASTIMYSEMCDSINATAEQTLPLYTLRHGVQRKVSETTKKLYDQRSNSKNMGKVERKALQKKIKEADLIDF